MDAFRGLLGAAMLLIGGHAYAGWEFGAGIGDEIIGETPGTAQLSYVFAGRYEQVVSLGGISERQAGPRRVSPNTLFASYLIRIPIKERFYFGVGAVAANASSEVISSNLAFTETLGWRINQRWLLEIRHISNLSIKGRNIGENLYTLNYRFD